MKTFRLFAYVLTLGLMMTALGTAPVTAAPPPDPSPFVRQLSLGGSFTPQAGASASEVGIANPEIAADLDRGQIGGASAPLSNQASQSPKVNRSRSRDHEDDKGDDHSNKPLQIPTVRGSSVAGSNPGLNVSFNGLNHRNQRLANGGNQFSLEPPDQGLCAGNGNVMEVVNDVMRVYDTAGNPVTGVIDLNTFYGFPAAIVRPAGPRGPFVTDPGCLFDAATQRWFVLVLTLEVNSTTGAFLGANHLDLAVSAGASPTGAYNIYHLPVQDDGTAGTPDHKCSGKADGTGHGACLGDFPHIGADKNAIVLTTNEYSFNGPEFIGAQVYAISKSALAAGTSSITVVQFNTQGAVGGQPGFTVWPAIAPAGVFENSAHGTEYFLSSTAADEVTCPSQGGVGCNGPGISNNIVLWALTNTESLNTASPSLTLKNRVLKSEVYAFPPKSEQKAGNFPLGQCINDTTLATPFGPGCWQILFNPPAPAHNEVESHLDSSDTRILTTWYANRRLMGALGTALKVGGVTKAGIAYFIVKPEVEAEDGKVSLGGEIEKQGYVALANNNLTYPTIATKSNGEGVMAFTLVGADYFPSAGYVPFSSKTAAGAVHVASAGLGPTDGFTSYKAFVGNPPRTRWGDYGAAVSDGNTIWFASEYIAQTCTLGQFYPSPPSLAGFGSCGATRTSLANWGTRITNVTP